MTDSAGLKWSAIIIGCVAAICGTMVAGFGVGMIAGIALATPGASFAQVQQQLMANTPFLIAELVVLLGFSGYGGFVAARRARRAELAHAAATALAYLGLALLVARLWPNWSLPAWYVIARDLVVVPAALFGGLEARRANAPAPAA